MDWILESIKTCHISWASFMLKCQICMQQNGLEKLFADYSNNSIFLTNIYEVK
jgi:hypothetical protein